MVLKAKLFDTFSTWYANCQKQHVAWNMARSEETLTNLRNHMHCKEPLANLRNHCYLEEKQLVTDFHGNFQQFVESTDNWKPTKQQHTFYTSLLFGKAHHTFTNNLGVSWLLILISLPFKWHSSAFFFQHDSLCWWL